MPNATQETKDEIANLFTDLFSEIEEEFRMIELLAPELYAAMCEGAC